MSALGVFTTEAVQESKEVMRSRNFHVRTNGDIAHSLATDTVDFLFGAMTGSPVVSQEMRQAIASGAVALESLGLQGQSYTEEGVFRSNGKKYDLAKVFAMIAAGQVPLVRAESAKMAWVLEDLELSEARVALADVSYPLVVVPYASKGDLLVVDGVHRLTRLMRLGVQEVSVYMLTNAQLNAASVA